MKKQNRSLKLIRCLLSISFLCISARLSAGVIYENEVYTYTQPDGESISVTLNGNSYYAEQRSSDGRLLINCKNTRGLCYAKITEDKSTLVSTEEIAREPEQSYQEQGFDRIAVKPVEVPKNIIKHVIQRNYEATHGTQVSSISANDRMRDFATARAQAAPLEGTLTGLTLLLYFPEENATISRASVENFTNQIGYNNGPNRHSIRDYFRTASGNKLDYINIVPAYVRARNSKAHFNSLPYGAGARTMIEGALADLNQRGFDFSRLSRASDGRIAAINVFYVGDRNTPFATGLWPHKGSGLNFCADGVCARQYQITDMKDTLRVGTFVHESGHLLAGWPDLYDYDGSSKGSVAKFGVMGNGIFGNTPVMPVATLRDLVGWTNITELNPAINANAPRGRISAPSNSNSVFKWSNPSRPNDEAFYIESIYRSGQNVDMPDSGLAIWHFDSSGTNTTEVKPYIQMEHADAARDPENNRNLGDDKDLYSGISGAAFSVNLPNSVRPSDFGTNSRWSNNSDSGLVISNISSASSTAMAFTLGDSGAASKADLSSPSPGTRLGGSSQNFSWNRPVGANNFDLLVGTTGPGSTDIRASSVFNNTSLNVSGLPTDGRTIYVRLWTRNGSWEFNDYTFTAATASVPARLTSHVSGDTLEGAQESFSWNRPSGATSFDILVGTSGPGSTDIRASSVFNNTSLNVSGLPTDGRTIYVRLWTRNGSWEFNDYTFTAATASVPARLTSHVSGATLKGSQESFSWNRPSGATSFDILVGTSGPGSTDIRSSSVFNNTSFTVTGLPTDRRTVYVRLWARSGSWKHVDYVFTASSAAKNAHLSSPKPATQLSGRSQTFNWNRPSGAIDFDMYIGTTGPGSRDIRGSSVFNNTSIGVNNLPTNGSDLYLRLWTFNNGWDYNDYVFKAANGS